MNAFKHIQNIRRKKKQFIDRRNSIYSAYRLNENESYNVCENFTVDKQNKDTRKGAKSETLNDFVNYSLLRLR